MACEFAAVGEEWLYPTPVLLPDEQAAAMARVGDHGAPGALPVRPAQVWRNGLCFRRRRWVGSMVVQWPGGRGGIATSAGSPERVELCKSLGADLALNYKTDDIPARLREFPPKASTSGTRPSASRTSKCPFPCSASTAG